MMKNNKQTGNVGKELFIAALNYDGKEIEREFLISIDDCNSNEMSEIKSSIRSTNNN